MADGQQTDSTLFELALSPYLDDISNYYSHKFGYLFNVLVINNNTKEILYHMAGFPLKVLTIFVYGKNTSVRQESEKYFSMSKCIIDDTSFSPSNHCIPSNKFVSGTNLHKDKEQCNDALYTHRVKKTNTQLAVGKDVFDTFEIFACTLPMILPCSKQNRAD